MFEHHGFLDGFNNRAALPRQVLKACSQLARRLSRFLFCLLEPLPVE